jgi:hypothetical protein
MFKTILTVSHTIHVLSFHVVCQTWPTTSVFGAPHQPSASGTFFWGAGKLVGTATPTLSPGTRSCFF